MSMPSDVDSLIGLLEAYVLSDDKYAYIRTLVPSSSEYKLLSTFHELNSKGTKVSNEVQEILKEWRESNRNDPKAHATVIRHLLMRISDSMNGQETRSLIQQVDSWSGYVLGSLSNFTKPVIMAAGEEFKEAKELSLPSNLETLSNQKVALDSFVKLLHSNTEEISRIATPEVFYYIDMEIVAKKDPAHFEKILNRSTDYTNYKNLVEALEQLVKKKKKDYKYYVLPETYFDRLSLGQLTSVGKNIKESRRQFGFCKNLFLKTYDVRMR